MNSNKLKNLNRLFNPKNIAVFGGNDAEIVISQCKKMGFKGEIWPVNPKRESINGINLNEIINQSYLYNGLEAYAWSAGVIEISKSSFPFIGNNESHLSCLISHELAHLLKNHRHKKLVDFSKELQIIGSNKISENQKKDIEYSIERKLELEADQIASKMIYLAGYDKYSCLFVHTAIDIFSSLHHFKNSFTPLIKVLSLIIFFP